MALLSSAPPSQVGSNDVFASLCHISCFAWSFVREESNSLSVKMRWYFDKSIKRPHCAWRLPWVLRKVQKSTETRLSSTVSAAKSANTLENTLVVCRGCRKKRKPPGEGACRLPWVPQKAKIPGSLRLSCSRAVIEVDGKTGKRQRCRPSGRQSLRFSANVQQSVSINSYSTI